MVGRGGGLSAPAMIAVAVAGAVAACAPASRVAPAATVSVHGVVDAPDGAHAAGVRVGLVKQVDAGELLGGLFVIGVSLGLACFGGAPDVPAICARQASSVTGGDGRFGFQLRGSDTQGSLGRASTFSIVAALPSRAGELTGPSTAEELEIQASDLEVPALRLWRPPVSVAAARTSLHVDWPQPSSDYGGSPRYDVRFQDAGSLPVWTFPDTHPGAGLDPRLLEDSHGGALVEAHTEAPATGTTARFTYRSATVAYRGTAGAPASRGRPCTISRAGAVAVPLSPCALTDGDLVHATLPGAAAPPAAAATAAATVPVRAQVDMGAPVPVGLVVVRGCPGCQVEGSADGGSWSPLGTVPAEPGVVEPPGGRATARYVRAAAAGGVGSLREISVWTTNGASAAVPAPPGGSAAGGGAGAAAPAPPADLRPLMVGLLALAAAVGALALVMARRRGP